VSLAERTYRQVAELERAGISRKTAFQQIAERDGASVGAVSQRYYVAARANGKPQARPAPTKSTSTSDESLSDALDRVVEILRDVIPIARMVEADAIRFRRIRELTDA